MAINFAPDREFETLLEEHKKLGYPTKTALLNDALRLLKRQKTKELRSQWRKQAAAQYAQERSEYVWKDLDGEDFK